MPKRIEGPYDFSRYGFSRYADGATWEFTEGEDFTVRPESFARAARKWAETEGLDVEHKVSPPITPRDPAMVALRFRRRVRPIRREVEGA